MSLYKELDYAERIIQFVKTKYFVKENPNINVKDLERILGAKVDNNKKSDQLLELGVDEDQIANSTADIGLVYVIISDDEEGSWAGPWASEVYGTDDLWFVQNNNTKNVTGFYIWESVEYEQIYFSDIDSAISCAHEHAHSELIEIIDNR